MSYKSDLLAVFDRLKDDNWPKLLDGKYFWHVGNTLDTCVGLLTEGTSYWGPNDSEILKLRSEVHTMILQGHDFYLTNYDKQWWDDYGWWGITWAKIYECFDNIVRGLNPNPLTADQCLQDAIRCWTSLYVCSQDENQKVQPPLKGPVQGGCWNHPPSDKDGESDGMQNTVTNALAFMLSARLYQLTRDPIFLDATASQYLWFNDWLINYPPPKPPDPPPQNPPYPAPTEQEGLFRLAWIDSITNRRFLLVYERPHDPNNGRYNRGDPLFRAGALWSADQGILLAGLVTMLQQKEKVGALQAIKDRDPNFPTSAEGMVNDLFRGILYLYDTSKVLHETPLDLSWAYSFGNKYGPDYATGKGVLMRYLQYIRDQPELSNRDGILWSAMAVQSTAQNNAQKQPPQWKIDFQWDTSTDSPIGTNESEVEAAQQGLGPPDVWAPTLQCSGLDALVAGIQYLYGAPPT